VGRCRAETVRRFRRCVDGVRVGHRQRGDGAEDDRADAGDGAEDDRTDAVDGTEVHHSDAVETTSDHGEGLVKLLPVVLLAVVVVLILRRREEEPPPAGPYYVVPGVGNPTRGPEALYDPGTGGGGPSTRQQIETGIGQVAGAGVGLYVCGGNPICAGAGAYAGGVAVPLITKGAQSAWDHTLGKLF
jgi:hypothetical protein